MINFQRVTAILTDLDDEWNEVQIQNQPRRFIIRRVRAEIVDDDSWAETIAVRIGQSEQVPYGSRNPVADSTIGFTHTVIGYDATLTPLDSLEYLYFEASTIHPTNTERGSVYVAVQLDTDPAGGQNTNAATAVVVIDIEVLS